MRPFWIRLALLAIVSAGGQVLVGPLLADREYPGRATLEGHLQRPVEILYLGDSVLNWTARGDADRRGIPAMLRDLLPSRTIGDVSNQAFDLDLFDALTARLSREPRPPSIVVIPVNLRTFSPVWDLAPPYQFRSVKFRLLHGDFAADTLLGPLSALKLYSLNPVSEAEYRSTPVLRGDRVLGRIGDFVSPDREEDRDRRLADLFALNYLHPLKADHRKIRSLRSIAERCRRLGLRPVFYITPLDLRSGIQWIGPEFAETVARNSAVIRETLASLGLPLLELTAHLDADHFDWSDTASPNEHLREAGRRHVAEQLARVLVR